MKTESSSPAKFPGHPTMNETAPVQVDSDSDGQGCEADKGCPQPDPASSGPQDPAQTMLPQAESVQACSPTKVDPTQSSNPGAQGPSESDLALQEIRARVRKSGAAMAAFQTKARSWVALGLGVSVSS